MALPLSLMAEHLRAISCSLRRFIEESMRRDDSMHDLLQCDLKRLEQLLPLLFHLHLPCLLNIDQEFIFHQLHHWEHIYSWPHLQIGHEFLRTQKGWARQGSFSSLSPPAFSCCFGPSPRLNLFSLNSLPSSLRQSALAKWIVGRSSWTQFPVIDLYLSHFWTPLFRQFGSKATRILWS